MKHGQDSNGATKSREEMIEELMSIFAQLDDATVTRLMSRFIDNENKKPGNP